MKTGRALFRDSLLLKLGGALALIACMAILGMASSGIIADSVQGSGEAINLAGSLRMQAYKMTSLAQATDRGSRSEQLRREVEVFERKLADPRIAALLPLEADTPLAQSYDRVQMRWKRVKPAFLSVVETGAPTPDVSAKLADNIDSLFN